MFRLSFHRIFASIHTNSSQRIIVGRQMPFSVCTHTNCIQTYVEAMKKIHCTGMKNKQTKSLVTAMQMNKNEKAYKDNETRDEKVETRRSRSLTNPLYLYESYTDRRRSQNGQRYSNLKEQLTHLIGDRAVYYNDDDGLPQVRHVVANNHSRPNQNNLHVKEKRCGAGTRERKLITRSLITTISKSLEQDVNNRKNKFILCNFKFFF